MFAWILCLDPSPQEAVEAAEQAVERESPLDASIAMTTVDACQAEEDALKGGSKGAKAAKWASAVLQRRAWSKAWLALLRLPLPQDILKKAGALSQYPHLCVLSSWGTY